MQTFTEVPKVSSKQNSVNSKTVIETSNLKMETKAASVQSSRKEMRDNIVDFGGRKNNSKNNNFVPTNLINSNLRKLFKYGILAYIPFFQKYNPKKKKPLKQC